jgi:hypothetical protein
MIFCHFLYFKKKLTDFIPYGRTDFRTYIALHCIALHCIVRTLHCIVLYCTIVCSIIALHCIVLHCILTERNVNSTACLLLNVPSVTFNKFKSKSFAIGMAFCPSVKVCAVCVGIWRYSAGQGQDFTRFACMYVVYSI